MNSKTKKWLIVLGALIVFGIIKDFFTDEKPKQEETTEVKAEAPLTGKEKFLKEQCSSWDGHCKPVKKYLKQVLNDPSSLEIQNTWVSGMALDSTFAIKTSFRAKNEFNALMLYNIYCKVDFNGNLTDIKIE